LIKSDCIYFKGDKPCRYKILCEGCPHYTPFPCRILIIKCRAQGDVLRTTTLLTGLKRRYPDSHISWVVDGESIDLLENNPLIDRVMPYTWTQWLRLEVGCFDVLICLDKEPESIALASRVRAESRFGFGMNEFGGLIPFNPAAAYSAQLGVDDELKFRKNQKTYQQIIYETAEIPYQNDRYVFSLDDAHRKPAGAFFRAKQIDRRRTAIGFNTGAGVKFETKQWPPEHYIELARLLKERMDANIFLLGGRRETALNRDLEEKIGSGVYNTGNHHSLLEFSGFLDAMDVIVTSDTLGMHLALALGKKVVALFGPTCPQEIDMYGQGVKLFANAACSPCYRQTCESMECMRTIKPSQVLTALEKIL